MPRARAASPAPAVLLPLALVAATFIVVAGLIVIAVAPPVVVYVLDWVRDTRVEGVAVTGELLSLAESQNIYTIDGTLPGNVPRLASPADTCTGLMQQNGTGLACVPYLAGNGTLGLCGACAAGQSIRLGSNEPCYECFTPNATALLPLTGTGGVGAEQRANDTLVYTNAFSWITDPMPTTAYISSYIFSSGSSSVTVWPPGVAGNTANNTMYKLDLAMNVYLTLNPFAAPNPDLGAVLMFTDIDNYFPDPVTNPYIDRFHSVGSASCAYNNGASPLQLPFGGHGAHGNVNSYVFYFPMLDSGSYPVYTGRCEIRIEMWLESPGGGGLIEE